MIFKGLRQTKPDLKELTSLSLSLPLSFSLSLFLSLSLSLSFSIYLSISISLIVLVVKLYAERQLKMGTVETVNGQAKANGVCWF